MSESSKFERDKALDVIKGMAIVLVIFTHCIQCGSGEDYYNNNLFFENMIFKTVYSFHMPVLMLVSGYLFYCTGAVKRPFSAVFVSRLKSLIIPVFSWNLLVYIRHAFSDGLIETAKGWVVASLTGFWFLWALFLCTVYTNIAYKNEHLTPYLLLLAFFVSFVTPDIYNSECYKFMFPFFVIGVEFGEYDIMSKIKSLKAIYVLALLGLFIALVLGFSVDKYIYVSGWTFISKNVMTMLMTDLYRILIGFVGSILFIKLSYSLVVWCDSCSNGWIISLFSKLGTASMGLYILSIYADVFLQKTTKNSDYNILLIIAETIAIVGASYLAVVCIRKVKILDRLLLGGRK